VQPQSRDGAHASTHCPPTQVSPHPQGVLHPAGVQLPPVQSSPPGQVCTMQRPPQPSESPHCLPAQLGWHSHSPFSQSSFAAQVCTVQRPPQPFESPHCLPVQSGVQHMP
jgi:hypothetical protein